MAIQIPTLRKPRRRSYGGSVEPYQFEISPYGQFDATYFAGAFVASDSASALRILAETEMKANWADTGAPLVNVPNLAEVAAMRLGQAVDAIGSAISSVFSWGTASSGSTCSVGALPADYNAR